MGKEIKIAIARMMAVLMVATLIPFDMLAPARVAKAAELSEISGTQKHDFSDGIASDEYFMIAGSAMSADNVIAGVLYGGKSYTGALKMNGEGKVKFKAPENSMLELLVYIPDSGSLKIDNTPITTSSFDVVDSAKKIYWYEKALGPGVSATDYNHIVEKGSGESQLFYIAVTAGDSVKDPTASITSGTEVIEGTELTLNCATEGASIYYTIDGKEPTSGSILYKAPISLDTLGEHTIKAIAIKGEGTDAISSKVVSFTYTVKEETILAPTASIASNTKVQKNTTLTLETETGDAEIRYTLNGDEPSESSTKYDGEAFSLGSTTGEVTVKAIAIKGTKRSSVATFTYTITGDKLATPTANPNPAQGEVTRGTTVALSCSVLPTGGVIRYTTDNSTPSATNGTTYITGSPIEITKDMTIKAIALSETNADSDVATFTYTIKKPAIKPSSSESILSSVALNGDITFKANGQEIFNVEIKAEKVSTPSTEVKTAAENLKETGGEILYYDFTLINKDNANDTVSVVKGASTDGVAPSISITMPYTIVNPAANKLNNIIVLHGTEKIESVSKGNEGFTFNVDSFSPYTVIVNPKAASLVDIIDYAGYEEGAYAEWKAVEGADGYMAYVASAGGEWKRIDDELIRQYADYWRVDTVGLAKGNYFIKIDAVTLDANKTTATVIASDVTDVLKVTNYDRSGFAFSEASSLNSGSKDSPGSGAYKNDGTLREGAIVLYVNNENFKNVSVTVKDSNQNDVTFTGIQAIVDESGVSKIAPNTPIDIRIIGTIDQIGFPSDKWVSSEEGLQIKSNKNYGNKYLTIEGIGEDAVVSGFGFLVRNCGNVEFRNFAVMNFNDDGISLDTKNCNIWIHDMDFFYGNPGGDSDQAKGDGTIDLKGHTQYCTFSYNHFWDSGKSSLCGMKSESDTDYVTYHHNWFDHSDSRHPRIRTMSVHVYNNYYDGNSKYGVGMTMGGSAFVEANYFRNCPYPMMISKQGTDAKGAGTFSGENGGVIKAYNNYMEGVKSFIPYSVSQTDFDAYVVETKSDSVPASVKAKAGGTSYNNFDTANTMYSYEADTPEDAMLKVVDHAGRLNGGDLHFTFDNEKDDASYAINSELKKKVVEYKPSVEKFGSGVPNTGVQVEEGGSSTTAPGYTPKNVKAPKANLSSRQVAKDTQITLSCETQGAKIYYTLDGTNPTTGSNEYTEGTTVIKITEATTVKAIAVLNGEKSDVSTFRYTVANGGSTVSPTPGGEDEEQFEIKTYMFNPEADGMAQGALSASVTKYGTDGYFTIDNADGKAKISSVSTSDPPKPKDAPEVTHGVQEEYLIRFSFGEKTTSASKQAIRFTNEHEAKVYIGAYVSDTDAKAGKTKLYLDTDENATTTCVKASTEYSFDVEAGDHVIYAKDDGTAYILYVVVEEKVPKATTPPTKYTIKIDRQDGTTAVSKVIEAGTALTATDLPANLTREGYTFHGWVDEVGNVITVPYAPAESMTIKAKWQKVVGENEYAITIDKQNGTAPEEKVIKKGTALTATDLPANLTREGYTFKGWVDEEGEAITVPYTPSKSMTIKARWQKNVAEGEYAITIDRRNGTTPKEKVIKAGTELTETDLPATLTREGYTFQGWVDEEGNAITVPYTPTKSMTIKAQWQSTTTEPKIGLHVELAVPNKTYVYTGSAIKPAIIVTNNGETLIEGVDYTVKYSNNIKACEWGENETAPKTAPKVTVTGKGNLTGSTFTNFRIAKKDIGETDTTGGTAPVKAGAVTVAKNSKATPVLVYNGVKLGTKDYTYTKPEQKNQKFGDASKEEAEIIEIELEGTGNYRGTRIVTVKAVKKDDLKTFTVTVGRVDLTYNGESQQLPADAITVRDKKTGDTLTNDKDHTYYEIVYGGDTTSAGTVKFSVIGMGDYTGTVSKTYTIKPLKDNTKFYVDAASIKASYDYNSAGVTLGGDLKVYYGSDAKGTKLQEGADYKVTYSNNKKVGTGKYTITFLGNFKGSKLTGEFNIGAASLKESKAQVEAADKVFKKAGIYKSTPIVTINGVALKASDYKVEYYIVNADSTETLMGGPNKVTAAGTTIKVKVTGKGSYKSGDEDCVTGTYTVCDKGTKTDLSGAKVAFYEKNADGTKGKKVTKLDYTGMAVEPAIVEVTMKGKTEPLKQNEDYTVRYVNNKNKGKATVIITAKGDSAEYVGSKTATFSIVAKNLKQTGLLDNLFKLFGK